MEKDKNKLSAARKKLQEYKLSKGVIPPGVGTTVQTVSETGPQSIVPGTVDLSMNGGGSGGQQNSATYLQEFHYPPPPRANTATATVTTMNDNNSSGHHHHQEPGAVDININNHNNQGIDHNQQIYTGYPAAPVIPPLIPSGGGSNDFDYSAAGLFNTSSSSSADHQAADNLSTSDISVMERNGNNQYHNEQEGSNAVTSSTSSYFIPTPVELSPPSDSIAPSAPLASELFNQQHTNNQLPQQQGRFTDAGQDFPVNFFQPIPVAQQYQPVSFNGNLFQQQQQQQQNNGGAQDFIYNNPQTPLFFNVAGNGSDVSMNPPPLSPSPLYPEQAPSLHINEMHPNTNQEPIPPSIVQAEIREEEIPLADSKNNEAHEVQESKANNEDVETGHEVTEDQFSVGNETTVEQTRELHPPETSSNGEDTTSTQNVIRSSPNFREPSLIRTTPTPLSRKLSESSQDDKDRQEIQLLQRLQSVQDALELQLEELRLDNKRLTERKSEMTSQLENCEKAIQDLRRERDHAREEAKKMLQPLHAKINALYEENQKIMQNSSNVGMELRVKLQEKTKEFENMQNAVIVVTNQKLELASELDHERERCKELEAIVAKQEEEIAILKNSNSKLEERVKIDQQKDAILHQMEDQRRHFQVQTETLQQELSILKEKLRKTAGSPNNESSPSPSAGLTETVTNQHKHDGHSCDSHGPGHEHPLNSADTEAHAHDHHDHHHDPGKSDSSDSHQHCHDHDGHEHDHTHSHDDHGHKHAHDGHGHGHNHSHDDHGHGHSHSHDHHDHSHDGHDHSHGHGHDHHDHSHDHSHDDHGRTPTKHTLSPEQTKNPVEEMKRRLHHLEWENSTFRSDVEKLAAEAKDKKQYEAKCIKLQEECDRLREECQRLELLVVQLQGENDTIGDYIALYQSQRLALKESAKEKDVQLENLAREREMLVAKMGELTQLLRELKGSSTTQTAAAEGESNQAGHICLGHHNHSPTSEAGAEPSKEIEGKIMNLLTEISSSSLIENFHPCAVCSGRLMNV